MLAFLLELRWKMPNTSWRRVSDADLPHAVIRFERSANLPRFSMKEGARWGFAGLHASEQLSRWAFMSFIVVADYYSILVM
jgi:hypothetical protein